MKGTKPFPTFTTRKAHALAQALHNSTTRQIVDTLRLSDRDLLRMVKIHLKPAAGGSPVAAANETPPIDPNLMAALPRMLMRMHDGVAHRWTTFLVKPCDIHSNGVVCLHGAFVHNGAKCAVLLRTTGGSPVQIPATVLHCHHLTGRLHQLVATFDEPVRLAHFCLADGVSIESALSACRAPGIAPAPAPAGDA
jgi:hypothetical protein